MTLEQTSQEVWEQLRQFDWCSSIGLIMKPQTLVLYVNKKAKLTDVQILKLIDSRFPVKIERMVV